MNTSVAPFHCPIAQLAGQGAVNLQVPDSTPAGAAIYCRMDDWQVALTLNQGEVGSNPTPASTAYVAARRSSSYLSLRPEAVYG